MATAAEIKAELKKPEVQAFLDVLFAENDKLLQAWLREPENKGFNEFVTTFHAAYLKLCNQRPSVPMWFEKTRRKGKFFEIICNWDAGPELIKNRFLSVNGVKGESNLKILKGALTSFNEFFIKGLLLKDDILQQLTAAATAYRVSQQNSIDQKMKDFLVRLSFNPNEEQANLTEYLKRKKMSLPKALFKEIWCEDFPTVDEIFSPDDKKVLLELPPVLKKWVQKAQNNPSLLLDPRKKQPFLFSRPKHEDWKKALDLVQKLEEVFKKHDDIQEWIQRYLVNPELVLDKKKSEKFYNRFSEKTHPAQKALEKMLYGPIGPKLLNQPLLLEEIRGFVKAEKIVLAQNAPDIVVQKNEQKLVSRADQECFSQIEQEDITRADEECPSQTEQEDISKTVVENCDVICKQLLSDDFRQLFLTLMTPIARGEGSDFHSFIQLHTNDWKKANLVLAELNKHFTEDMVLDFNTALVGFKTEASERSDNILEGLNNFFQLNGKLVEVFARVLPQLEPLAQLWRARLNDNFEQWKKTADERWQKRFEPKNLLVPEDSELKRTWGQNPDSSKAKYQKNLKKSREEDIKALNSVTVNNCQVGGRLFESELETLNENLASWIKENSAALKAREAKANREKQEIKITLNHRVKWDQDEKNPFLKQKITHTEYSQKRCMCTSNHLESFQTDSALYLTSDFESGSGLGNVSSGDSFYSLQSKSNACLPSIECPVEGLKSSEPDLSAEEQEGADAEVADIQEEVRSPQALSSRRPSLQPGDDLFFETNGIAVVEGDSLISRSRSSSVSSQPGALDFFHGTNQKSSSGQMLATLRPQASAQSSLPSRSTVKPDLKATKETSSWLRRFLSDFAELFVSCFTWFGRSQNQTKSDDDALSVSSITSANESQQVVTGGSTHGPSPISQPHTKQTNIPSDNSQNKIVLAPPVIALRVP